MILDRRNNQRHKSLQPLIVTLSDLEQSEISAVKLVDLNTDYIRVAAEKLLDGKKEFSLNITIPDADQMTVRLSARLEEIRPSDNSYHYVFRFDPFDTDNKTQLSKCLDFFTVIPDRRDVQTKTAKPGVMNGLAKDAERRITKPVFLKCMRYNRIEKMMEKNNYFYMRELQSGSRNRVIMKGKELVNCGSNNYLGLTAHPEVNRVAIETIQKYGVGSGGSRILCGTMDLHNKLERKLAAFIGGEDCIVYCTGQSTNVGMLSALLNKEDSVFIDANAHASIIDGVFASGAQTEFYKHNDMKDLEKDLGNADHKRPKLIITEGVFSMDGDIAHLDQIYELSRKYNAAIMVDDAHGTGVLGKHGRGTAEYFGLEGKIDIIMGTLSKAIGIIGGFVVANKKIIHYLKHNSRSFLFTTSLPPAISASIIKSVEIIETDFELRRQLWANINFVKKSFIDMGFDVSNTESSIIPLVLRNENIVYKMTGMLADEGIFTCPVAYPAVRKKESRIRVSVMATHTQEDLELLVSKVKKVGKQLEII